MLRLCQANQGKGKKYFLPKNFQWFNFCKYYHQPLYALGQPWHETCFVCSHPKCGKILDPNDFAEHDGKPYCRDHYNQLFPQCHECHKPIMGKVIYLDLFKNYRTELNDFLFLATDCSWKEVPSQLFQMCCPRLQQDIVARQFLRERQSTLLWGWL